MNIKTLTAGFLTLLLMGGAAQAMDSAAIEEHMEKINEQYVQTSEQEGEVEALEEKVEALEEMIQMMLDDQDS
ncbi:hypothetical protein [Halomonas saccharevitans]|uniref:Adhesion protein FadA n=1 Tax=Halomonas saccharevitans TaxID=416872 RepID=A0A1I6Y2C8_9GAMM|nr:hypothetical protein [Halomonas saccharevitans]SFT44533.1 hypothetical protein SAMN04487956_10412 [Halomonas saccharevitans]